MNFFALQLSRVVKHWCDVYEKSNWFIQTFPSHRGAQYSWFRLTSTFNFASIICYCCWCCYWHHLVLWFCLLNLFIFHRAARNLLEDFVGIYLDGNSSFLQETVDKKCLQFEVNISFMLSICKHEICTFIMWKAICVGYIYIYKLYI